MWRVVSREAQAWENFHELMTSVWYKLWSLLLYFHLEPGLDSQLSLSFLKSCTFLPRLSEHLASRLLNTHRRFRGYRSGHFPPSIPSLNRRGLLTVNFEIWHSSWLIEPYPYLQNCLSFKTTIRKASWYTLVPRTGYSAYPRSTYENHILSTRT